MPNTTKCTVKSSEYSKVPSNHVIATWAHSLQLSDIASPARRPSIDSSIQRVSGCWVRTRTGQTCRHRDRCLWHVPTAFHMYDSDGFLLTRRSRASCVEQGRVPQLPSFEACQPSIAAAVASVCTWQTGCAVWLPTCTTAFLAMCICGILVDSSQGHE